MILLYDNANTKLKFPTQNKDYPNKAIDTIFHCHLHKCHPSDYSDFIVPLPELWHNGPLRIEGGKTVSGY
jgi:hypothetical protein